MMLLLTTAAAVLLTPAPDDRAFSASYPLGAVAADHPLASEAGAAMLRRGGNAVDAAVAAGFTLSVVRPESCGVGGGGFMVIYLPADPVRGRVVTAIDHRETAPAGVTPETYEHAPDGASINSGLGVGVPGTVAGLLHALEKYGTLDRAAVLQPAIDAATAGFEADAHYVRAVRSAMARLSPEARGQRPFLWNNLFRSGEVEVGDLIVNHPQAELLSAIAAVGPGAFYHSSQLEATVVAAGGVMTREDLASYRVNEVRPLEMAFAGRTLLAMPPPSSGGVCLGMTLGVLERQLAAPLPEWTGPRWHAGEVHALTEAYRHAFADRARWLGDPAFVDVPVQRLLSDAALSGLAARVRADLALDAGACGTTRDAAPGAGASEAPRVPPDDAGTSHLSAVDRWGGAVACTQTINLEFGSLVTVEDWGICLNNEMDDFTTRRGHANAFALRQSERNLPAPGKRPLSSMSPTIVLDAEGRVEAVAGASGGPRIITATSQALLHALVRGLPAADAVSRPRFHHQWSPHLLQVEPAFLHDDPDGSMLADLRARGHTVTLDRSGAAVQVILRRADGTGWDAACDPRKGGRPAGH